MRQPKLSNLTIDAKGTRMMRKTAAKSNKVTITINIDEESLARLRTRSNKTGVPYQRLLNQILREALKGEKAMESRLEKLERELERLKKIAKRDAKHLGELFQHKETRQFLAVL